MDAVGGAVVRESETPKVPLPSKDSRQGERVVGSPLRPGFQWNDLEALVGSHYRGRIALRDRVFVVLQIKLMRGLVIDDGRKNRSADCPGYGASLSVVESEVFDFRHQALALDAGNLLDR